MLTERKRDQNIKREREKHARLNGGIYLFIVSLKAFTNILNFVWEKWRSWEAHSPLQLQTSQRL